MGVEEPRNDRPRCEVEGARGRRGIAQERRGVADGDDAPAPDRQRLREAGTRVERDDRASVQDEVGRRHREDGTSPGPRD
jgi:hypothetical protein